MASSGQEWQYVISTVRPHISRSTDRSPPWYWHLVVRNGDITFLQLEIILADQLADIPPVVASSGQEQQYVTSTVRAHIVRSTDRSTSQ